VLMNFTTKSDADTEFEEKIVRIAEKLSRISNKYFMHPVKMRSLRVPFRDYDVLKIAFREPVELRYEVEYNHSIESLYSSRVFTNLDCCIVAELDIVFENNNISAVKMRDINENTYEYLPLSASTTLILAMLFVSDVFEKLVEAEISSDRGVAVKWFTKIIDAYRDVSEYVASINLEDLYDKQLTIDNATVYIIYRKNILEFVLDKNRNELLIIPHIYTDSQLFNIGTICYSLQHRKLYMVPITSIIYTPSPLPTPIVNYIMLDTRKIKDPVAKFSEKIFDDIDGFLKKFFRAYIQLVVALHYYDYIS